MGSGLSSRARDAERATSAAWDDLVDAMTQASGAARSLKRRTAGLAGNASDRMGAAAGEARWRARATRDALAGKRPRMPWLWFAAAAAAGIVAGLAAGAAARRAVADRADAMMIEEEAVATGTATPVTLVEATVPVGNR